MEKKPVLAICYDFDKTLTPDNMQAQGYIQDVGFDVDAFWKKSNDLAMKSQMDFNLAYMYTMVSESEGKLILNREALESYGSRVRLYPGVETWFSRLRALGEENGVSVEHYIISAGLREMIDGTKMARAGDFTRIYASSFYFNDRGVAKWPAQTINYTEKTQYLFRISKGALDINDNAVNKKYSPEEYRVPFRNMVYIGDSETDIPCMKLVQSYGGHSIGVYDPDRGSPALVSRLLLEDRIRYFAPADYREGSELDRLLAAIIRKTAADEVLVQAAEANRRQARDICSQAK